MAEIPDHRNAPGLGQAGQCLHVVKASRLVIRVRQEQCRDLVIERVGELGCLDQALPDAAARKCRQPLHHIGVCREISGFRKDDGSLRCKLKTGAQGFENIHGGRFASQHFIGVCTDQSGNLGTQPARGIDPVMRIPGPDQVLAPFLLQDLFHARRDTGGSRAERITVQIDDTIGQVETGFEARQGIGGIEGLDIVACFHVSSLSTARTGAASAPAIFRGRAINS